MDWTDVVDAFNAAYAGYVVPLSMTADDLRHRCVAEDVSLERSVVVVSEGRDVGIGLVAVRGARARLAAFGIAADRRGRGLGALALEQVLARAADAERWELEVIEQNGAAVRLYEARGFRVVDRLLGYERPPEPDRGAARLHRVSVQHVAERMSRASTEDLPWQLDPRTLGRLREPWIGIEDDRGGRAFVDPSPEDAVVLRWFVDDGTSRLVDAIAARYAATRPIRIVPLVPSGHDAKLRRLGFVPQPIVQLRMVRENREKAESAPSASA